MSLGAPDEGYRATNALTQIAVVQVERGDIAKAQEIVQIALEHCGSYCKTDSLRWAHFRIAWAQADLENTADAKETLRDAIAVVGDDKYWLDKARYRIALAHARKREAFNAVEAVQSISREDWRKEA